MELIGYGLKLVKVNRLNTTFKHVDYLNRKIYSSEELALEAWEDIEKRKYIFNEYFEYSIEVYPLYAGDSIFYKKL